jgi:hypothetical protein
MNDPIIVIGLRRKRDEISGVVAGYEKKISEARADLAHVVAALRLFEATGEASELPPYIDLNRLLKRGETTEICMRALTDEGPLDTRELTQRVMKAKGFDLADKVMAQSIALRIVQTLRMRVHNGKLDKPAMRKGVCLWQIPTKRRNGDLLSH